MQRKEYARAKILLNAVTESGAYILVDNYNNNFLEETVYNDESIFEIGFMDKGGSFNCGITIVIE